MITFPQCTGQKSFVLGYGKSGVAAATVLRASGSDVVVWDDQPASRTKAAAAGFTVADPMTVDLTGFYAMIVGPGVPVTHPVPHPALAKAREADVPLWGEMDVLFRACPEATYVGITGTNGKSTTTALIGHILKQAGRKVEVGGNLGTPALGLEPLGADGIYVIELSSFQLDLMQENKLDVAVWLNTTPDHLDRHGTMAGYVAAKSKIISTARPQTLIIGSDDPETAAVAAAAQKQPHLTVQEISTRHPVRQGFISEDRKLAALTATGSQPLIDMRELPYLPGDHNAQNACAAFAAGRALGLDDNAILAGLHSFTGLAHRQQRVATDGTVLFVNDSKATNADATSKALTSYDNIFWIVGGKPKAGGLNGLESLLAPVRHAYLIGQAAEAFALWLAAHQVPFTQCGTLDKAVAAASAAARATAPAQAVVLLSPACASFDQFSGYEERGDVFAALVQTNLSTKKGA